MLRLRLGFVLGVVALMAGCPEPVDDFRLGHNEAKAHSVEAVFKEGDYACPNLRPWREELDLPVWLSDSSHDKDDERMLGPGDILTARRERLKKEYVRDHQGTYVVCRTKLEVTEKPTADSSGRGTCPVCTEDLKNPKYRVQQINAGVEQLVSRNGQEAKRGEGDTAVELRPEQCLYDKIEFRLRPVKSDYVVTGTDQAQSFRDFLKKRGCEDGTKSKPEDPPHIEDYVAREKAKGAWTTMPDDDVKKLSDADIRKLAAEGKTVKILPKYDLPPLADPLVVCPTCGKNVSAIENRCWSCNGYYTIERSDERVSIAEPHELYCPICKEASVDPTLNYCNKCGYHRAISSEEVCWRCGGSHVCPECGGSGVGTSPIMGTDTCWLCGVASQDAAGAPNKGRCPECGKMMAPVGWGVPASPGFTIEDGALPPTFNPAKRNRKDDWRLSQPAKSGSSGSSAKSDTKPEEPKKGE